MNEHMVEIRHLSVDFHSSLGVVHAVRNVSLHVDQGEVLVLLGESGSGKSVTSSMIMGLIDSPPAEIVSGDILFRGQSILKLSEQQRRAINGKEIAMIFQEPLTAMNPVYSIGWQIEEVMRLHGADQAKAHAEAVRLLDRVGIPNAARRVHDYPFQFSGGQRQRIMIAMGMAMRPRVLIADEPTSALDVTVQKEILDLLSELQRESGMAMIMITHDLGVAARMADRIAVMKEGEVVETGATADVLAAPKHPYTRELLAATPGRGSFLRATENGTQPLITVRDLVKTYGAQDNGVRAVDRATFSLYPGESIGIVGESGSGKSTLVNMMLGLVTPTSGSIVFDGRELSKMSRDEMFRFRRRMQVVFQDPTESLNPFMSVQRIISEPWAIHKTDVPKSEWPARVRELLARVGLKPEYATRYPHQLSGGQRQRIAIARAVALRPEVVVCDEALSALDVSTQAQILNLLRELREEFRLSYLFVSHDLSMVRDFCSKTIVMHGGKIVEANDTAALFKHPVEPYTRQLLAAASLGYLEESAALATLERERAS